MNNYRGDTFWRTFKVKYENQPYVFQAGDTIIVAFIYNGVKYLTKEITLNDIADSIKVEWSATEMATLKYNVDYILEAELTTQDFKKTYQETIRLDKDYIL